MNILELKIELDSLGVNPNLYSLNGDLKSDRVILTNPFDKVWKIFYLD